MIEQRTEEWFKQRLGKVTASAIANVIAKTKTGVSASRDNYSTQLTLERLTGQQAEFYTNSAMEWGTATEPQARQAYEVYKGVFVDETGFVNHTTIEMSGASPDGLVGEDGLVEIKCPESKTQMETLLNQKVPTKYIPQMQWQMACTGRKWCDFVSFDPRMPDNLQLFVSRVNRDDTYINMLETEVKAFLAEIDQKIETLRKIK
jgi:putative phage-type endonuclease